MSHRAHDVCSVHGRKMSERIQGLVAGGLAAACKGVGDSRKKQML